VQAHIAAITPCSSEPLQMHVRRSV